MTPRTRTSNKDAQFKVYYSNKPPQQVYFPHRKKTVRRPRSAEHDGVAERQMEFLPEVMRQQKTKIGGVVKQEEPEEASIEKKAVGEKTPETTPVGRGNKRRSIDAREESALGSEPDTTSTKRRRRMKLPQEGISHPPRQQSTMTQLADGRKPSIGADEPDFKPIKRRSRNSLGAASIEMGRDKKQRTLTQMIPGLGHLTKEELDEMNDLDVQLEDESQDNGAISQSLIEQGLLELDAPHRTTSMQHAGESEDISINDEEEKACDVPIGAHEHPCAAMRSVEASNIDDDDGQYQPTQFIEAPSRRTRQTPRRTAARQSPSNTAGSVKSTKPRFSLLSTPEKRRIFEIPSSQSPSGSVISTQISPQKSDRSTLQERTSNITVVAETPSKRKQVTFRDAPIVPAPPVLLRKFESTIQDSEDEDGSEVEDDIATQQPTDNNRGSSEPEEASMLRERHQPSPELGESWAPIIYDDDGPEYETYCSTRLRDNLRSFRDTIALEESLPLLYRSGEVSQLDLTTQALLPPGNIPSTPPTEQKYPYEELPSTPMVIRDDFSDEEEAELRTLQQTIPQPPATFIHQSSDLDGEPVQVPRSPSAECETQQSHSSRAEQQLQSEWLSYSQYAHPRAPKSPSMHKVSTRFPVTNTLATSSARIHHSQATTVDENTPRKNRTQRVASAETTPHRASKSQLFTSPEKPPSLFIPSSFPSPSRTAMEGWSSPVMAKTQDVYRSSQVLGSLEDFSIPLPPPNEND